MKYRERINYNNAEYVAEVYEHNNTIIVAKHSIPFRSEDIEWFRFDNFTAYQKWLQNQNWAKHRRVVSKFKNVKGW